MIKENDRSNNNHNELFKLYFNILKNIINEEDSQIQNSEFIIVIMFKKILSSIIKPFMNDKKDNSQFERDFYEFFDLLIKYLIKIFQSLHEFISYFITDKVNKTVCFIVKNILYQINFVFLGNKKILNLIANNNNIYTKITKLIIEFDKTLNKLYSYNINSSISLSDFITDSLPEECLKEKIKIQKLFTTNFISVNIKEKFISTIETDAFNIEEIFESNKIIMKDNFLVSLFYRKKLNIVGFSIKENFLHSIKEIINIYRSSYNEETQVLNIRKVISKKKLLFTMDLSMKLLIYMNKLNTKLENYVQSSNLDSYSSIILDLNKLIENLTILITKEQRINGYDDLINTFTYDNLANLTEESINNIFIKIKSLNLNLFAELDLIKVSIDSENYFLSSFCLNIINKISEEIDKSLKKIPKNKNFKSLTKKTLKLFHTILGRFTISPATVNSFKKPLNNLSSKFSLLNQNNI